MSVISAASLVSRLLARALHPKYAVIGNQSGRFMSTSLDKKFELAQERVKELGPIESSEDRLKMDTLSKQATQGKTTKRKPSAVDGDWSSQITAWTDRGDSPKKDKAKQQYVDFVNKILTKAGKEPVV